MQSTINSQTQIPINNGRLQQVQQPVSFRTNASMTMNDDNTNIPISWTGIRCRTNGKFQVQPAQPMLLVRGYVETSSVSDDCNIVSEQYYHVHVHHNDDRLMIDICKSLYVFFNIKILAIDQLITKN